MGLFSKEACSICGNGPGKHKFSDGTVCQGCIINYGRHLNPSSYKHYSVQKIRDIKDNPESGNSLASPFMATKKIGKFFEVDEKNRQWCVPGKRPVIYSFSDIVAYELLEDGDSITKGGLGSAVVGGALLGGVGAIVGGATGKKKTKKVVNTLNIKITLNDINNPVVYIKFLIAPAKSDSFVYKTLYGNAQEVLSILSVIASGNETEAAVAVQQEANAASVADEIKKFKELLDMGAITEDEFIAKKTELLNL